MMFSNTDPKGSICFLAIVPWSVPLSKMSSDTVTGLSLRLTSPTGAVSRLLMSIGEAGGEKPGPLVSLGAVVPVAIVVLTACVVSMCCAGSARERVLGVGVGSGGTVGSGAVGSGADGSGGR